MNISTPYPNLYVHHIKNVLKLGIQSTDAGGGSFSTVPNSFPDVFSLTRFLLSCRFGGAKTWLGSDIAFKDRLSSMTRFVQD